MICWSPPPVVDVAVLGLFLERLVAGLLMLVLGRGVVLPFCGPLGYDVVADVSDVETRLPLAILNEPLPKDSLKANVHPVVGDEMTEAGLIRNLREVP